MTGLRLKPRTEDAARPCCIGAGACAGTSCTYRRATSGVGVLHQGIERCHAGAPVRGRYRRAGSTPVCVREAARRIGGSTRYGVAYCGGATILECEGTRTTAGAASRCVAAGQTTLKRSWLIWATAQQTIPSSGSTMTDHTLPKIAGGRHGWSRAQTVVSVAC